MYASTQGVDKPCVEYTQGTYLGKLSTIVVVNTGI